MNNIIVTGAGRSGTSLVAGLIASTNRYNIGGQAHKPDKWNEKGYFETNTVNKINNDILKLTPNLISTKGLWQGWLSTLPIKEKAYNNSDIQNRIHNVIKDRPFCLKDPRFSYTLPVWLPILPTNTKFICVFRHPSAAIKSILKHCDEAEYLKDIIIDQKFAEEIWYSIYNYIIINYRYIPWLFINYNQILDNHGIKKIENFIESDVNETFVEKRLRHHSDNEINVNKKLLKLYDELNYWADCPIRLR